MGAPEARLSAPSLAAAAESLTVTMGLGPSLFDDDRLARARVARPQDLVQVAQVRAKLVPVPPVRLGGGHEVDRGQLAVVARLLDVGNHDLEALVYDRVRAVVLGGLGIRLVEGVGLPDSIADALEAPSLADVTDPTAYMFRAFAEQTKSDLHALAACMRGSRQTLSRVEVGRITAPFLVAVGDKDQVAGSPEALAALIPRAQALVIPGRDHMLAVGDRVFKSAVLDFLANQP